MVITDFYIYSVRKPFTNVNFDTDSSIGVQAILSSGDNHGKITA